MKKKILLAVGLAVVLLVAGLTGCAADNGNVPANVEVKMNNQQEGIWVSGEGKVMAVPDLATISLGITARDQTVGAAQTQASDAMNKVMKALTDNGVAKKDIQTTQYNITRQTRWDNNKNEEVFVAYQVTNTVTAQVRDIAKAGSVIDAVAVAGGDLTRINSISLSVDNPATYQKDAREKAMTDAKEKAQQMANLAGVTLGKPTYVTESVYTPSPIYRNDMIKAQAASAPSAEPTPVSAGEQEITVNVQVVYDIK